jgi:hypothetical protein
LDVISSPTLLWCHSKGQNSVTVSKMIATTWFHISSCSNDLAFQFFSLEATHPIDAAEIK